MTIEHHPNWKVLLPLKGWKRKKHGRPITNKSHRSAWIRRYYRLAVLSGLCGGCRKKITQPNRRWCRSCSRKHTWQERKRRTGMTRPFFLSLWKKHKGRCELCRVRLTQLGAHVDHDHKTGKIRGLLCNNCNRGLGHFQDNPLVLRLAASYVERHRTNRTVSSE